MTELLWVSVVASVVLAALFWCWFAGWTVARVVDWWRLAGAHRSARRQLRFHLHSALVCRRNERGLPAWSPMSEVGFWQSRVVHHLDEAAACADRLGDGGASTGTGRGVLGGLRRLPGPPTDIREESHHG